MKPEKRLPVLYSLHREFISHKSAKDLDSSVALGKNMAVLYWMDTGELEDEVTFSQYYKLMSRERQRKVDSFLFKKDKRLSLGAGILMDKGLSAWGLCERMTEVSYKEEGKPFLPGYPHIHFNLSHSGSKAMAVFAGVENGCDIEKVQKADLNLARCFFTQREYDFIAGQQKGRQQDEAFTRLWTLKESFLKAAGTGLMLSLNAFEITILPEGKIILGRKNEKAQALDTGELEFREYRLGEYCAAVCLFMGCKEDGAFYRDAGGSQRKAEEIGRYEGIDH